MKPRNNQNRQHDDTISIKDKIEKQWIRRYMAHRHLYGKQGGRKYLEAQAEFFAGAINAMQCLDIDNPSPDMLSNTIPAWWPLAISSGRDIITYAI